MWIGSAPPLAPGFIERPALEDEVRAALVPGATVALVSEGARGKTQLAASVASSLDADLRIWVNATSRASVLSVYGEAAAVIGCPPATLPAWLRDSRRTWIAVFDDITGSADLIDLLPSGPSGRVLLTGPEAAVIRGSRVVPIGGFTRRESMAYLMGRLTGDMEQRQGAADLVTELGDEPQALAQASAVIASSELTCREYREHFMQEGAGFSAAEATWGLSIEHVDMLAPVTAQQLLAVASLLDRDGIPVPVFGDPTALDAARQAGLLSVDPDSHLVRLAAQVRAAIRAATPDGMLKAAVFDAADALLRVWPTSDQPEWLARSLRSCADSLRIAAGDLLWQGGCHEVLLRAGHSLQAAGLTECAAQWWRALDETAERLLGPDHQDTIAIRQRLTGADLAAGEYTKAIAALSLAVAEAERNHGPATLEALAAREQLAGAHRVMGGYPEAIALYRGVLVDRERTQGTRHPDTLSTGMRLAEVHLADGRTKVAISLYKRVLSDRERILGKAHLDTIAARAALGAAHHASGRMASAVQLYEQARDGYAAALGPDHRETLTACLRLAHGYYGVGRLGDAVRLLRETATRCETALPAADPLALTIRESLANIS